MTDIRRDKIKGSRWKMEDRRQQIDGGQKIEDRRQKMEDRRNE